MSAKNLPADPQAQASGQPETKPQNPPPPAQAGGGAITTEKKRDLKSLLNAANVQDQIARALPSHLTADRFIRVATTALLRVKNLDKCDQVSFMRAMLDCSSLGIEPDGRRAHLIPYWNKNAKRYECNLILDYKGLIELAKRSGEVLPQGGRRHDALRRLRVGERRHHPQDRLARTKGRPAMRLLGCENPGW